MPASTSTAWEFPKGLDQTWHKHKAASTLAGRGLAAKLAAQPYKARPDTGFPHSTAPSLVIFLTWDVRWQGGTTASDEPSSPTATGLGCGAD